MYCYHFLFYIAAYSSFLDCLSSVNHWFLAVFYAYCSKSLIFVFLTFFFKLSKAFSFFSYLLKEHFLEQVCELFFFKLSKAFSFLSYLLKEHFFGASFEKSQFEKYPLLDFVLRRNRWAILFQSAFKVLLLWQYLSHLI